LISEHFDSSFLAKVSPAQLNQAFESLGPSGATVTLVQLSKVTANSLEALVVIGPTRFNVQLSVDSSGLIAGLLFTLSTQKSSTWSQLDGQLKKIAPDVSFLAAKVNANGSCSPVHTIAPDTPRPLGSMFKLFVLGALANAIHEHKFSWTQKLTVTAAIKVGGSGTLQNAPDGTTLSVEQAAVKMISLSDNTAADMLLGLVGRTAVQNQVRAWSSHAALDTPFLTVQELFALKYSDFPKLATNYLSLSSAKRAKFLTKTVDKISALTEKSDNAPRDITTLEWFASTKDLCRAFGGLEQLETMPGLSPISKVLSTNSGGIGLSTTAWPTVWFKGGSEPGVLTIGYLVRDRAGQTFEVIVLTEDPKGTIATSAALQILGVVTSALSLLH
jgi:beta-lactamase class A